jgi:peroxiredoxin Q/BCP
LKRAAQCQIELQNVQVCDATKEDSSNADGLAKTQTFAPNYKLQTSNYKPCMATHLKVGDKAPSFTGIDQVGNKVSLADFKGQKIVLYFYPEDDTPTCTVQACNLRDNYALLKENGFVVIGVSPDDETKHHQFISKFSLPFTLLADPQHKIIDKYGVWGQKNLYGRTYMGLHRTTFVIDEEGVIQKIYLKPRNKAHAEEIIKNNLIKG